MINSFKKNFAYIALLAGVLVLPHQVSADPGLNMGLMNVAPLTGDFIVTTQLQPVEITSFSSFTLIGVIDADGLDMPLGDIRTLPINLNGGYINVNMMLNYDPAGYTFQFCLVDSLDLVTQGGQYLFNPNNPAYDPLYCSSPSLYQPGNQDGDADVEEDDTIITPDTTQPGTGSPNPIVFTTSIANPLGEDMDILDFLKRLFVNMVKIAFPFLVLFMMYAGFMFIEARGNEEKLKKAKKNRMKTNQLMMPSQ